MRKVISMTLIVTLLLGGMVLPVQAEREAGGIVGFFVGCCFGPRAAGDWNDGKSLHWLEWGQLIPIFGIVCAVINGINGYEGKTTADLAAEYGVEFY